MVGSSIQFQEHAPENAGSELKKAYDTSIESAMLFFWDRKAIAGVNPDEVLTLYKHAFDCHRRGRKLAAERWARTAKHLARAFFHEAKIVYLEPRITELPYLRHTQGHAQGAQASSTKHSDTTADLLDSVAEDLPPGFSEMPEDMKRYLARGRKHLDLAGTPQNELIVFERLQAAHEYGRVVECLALALEAEHPHPKAA